MIDRGYYSPPSLLSTDGFCQGLRLGSSENRYAPLENFFCDDHGKIRNSEFIYYNPKGELLYLTHVLERQKLPIVPRLLRLRNTLDDVRLRQDGVRELIRNPALYAHIERILGDRDLVTNIDERGLSEKLDIHYNLTTDRVQAFAQKMSQIGTFRPRSECWQRAAEWGSNLVNDTLFREQFRKYAEKKAGRIIRVYDDRARRNVFRIIKPGVDIDDFTDVLKGELTHYEETYETRKGPKTRTRKIIKHRPASDEAVHDIPFSIAKQDMETLNEITKKMVLEPMLYTHLQLQHLYMGAWLHHRFKAQRYPSCIPELTTSGEFVAKELFPVRLVLDTLGRSARYPLCPNDFDFKTPLVQAVGANRGGKSEAWRTINLASILANEGYPVPARSCTYSVVPRSHFIHCKGNKGHGGSELEHNLRDIMLQLPKLQRGDVVVLDELGDSSNGPTALELAKRLLPPLLEHCSRVYITSQHDAISQYVREIGGLTLAPDSNARGVKRFRLVHSTSKPDFRPGETLDSMEFTQGKVRELLQDYPDPSPVQLHIRSQQEENRRRGFHYDEEDVPF